MAKFKFYPTTNVDGYFTAKINDAIDDDDVGKPVKLMTASTDVYQLCSDGDGIDAFIIGLDPATADGKVLATLNNMGRVRCEASGAMNVGDYVEAGAVAAAGTAETNGLPVISTHTRDTTSAATLAADLFPVEWRVISANTSDGTITTGDQTVIIERL